ncbi:MAG: sulfatase, partial [Verrucomicrobiota bacterium]
MDATALGFHRIAMRQFLTPLVVSISLCSFAPEASADERPNIMVFLVDDMGVMDTSVPFLTDAEGKPETFPLNEYYRTPAMERLSARGVRFNQFYAMSVCSPTRISILTGQNAARHTATNWINPRMDNAGPQGPPNWDWAGLGDEDVTLPRLLQSAGYRTIHVGKAHFGPMGHPGEEPLNLGFEINVAGNSWGAPGSYYAEANYDRKTKDGKPTERMVPHLEAYHGSDTFLSEALTLEAKKQIAEVVAEDQQPFFLYFAHYAVHSPFHSDPRFAAHYEDSGKSANAQAFATLIEGMDKSLGDMLDQFEELGVAENTLVIFLGDNGSDAPLGDQHVVACAAPLRGKKGAHYEGGIRVPFIASWAKPDAENQFQQKLPIPQGVIQGQVASVEDIYPTLLSLTGVSNPEGHAVDGRPLATLLSGEPDEARSETFLMHYPHARHRSNYFTTWRNGDWKVIYHFLPDVVTHGEFLQSDGETYQLFNLAEDPYEQTNVAADEPEILKRMMVELNSQLAAHEALYP